MQHVLMQLLGEICHRFLWPLDFPCLAAAGDEWELEDSLQPGSGPDEQPVEAFPAAGFYRRGRYWGIPCAGSYVQNVSPSLGEWLKYSHEAVRVARARGVLQRLQIHEPATWRRLAGLEDTPQSTEDLLQHRHPALAMMYIDVKKSTDDRSFYLPTCAGRNVPTGCDDSQVGEVFWLFDQQWPYPVELFWEGVVPAARLPHFHRTSIKKNHHIARRLGQRQNCIKQVPASARMCPCSTGCDPLRVE